MDRHWGKAGSTAGLYHQTASTLMAILLIPQIIWFLSPLIIERWMGPNDYIDFAALLWLALNTILAASISGFSAFTLASGRNSFCRAHSAIRLSNRLAEHHPGPRIRYRRSHLGESRGRVFSPPIGSDPIRAFDSFFDSDRIFNCPAPPFRALYRIVYREILNFRFQRDRETLP